MSYWLSLLLFFAVFESLQLHPLPDETYDTKYDNIDIDELLNNDRLLNNYIKCLENKGPCTPDGKMLKETLPDAISTDCSKCSQKQKYGANSITHFLIDQRPQDWERLAKIYDQDDSYRQNYLNSKNLEIVTENQSKEVSTTMNKGMTASFKEK